jgi:hypothetical protein
MKKFSLIFACLSFFVSSFANSTNTVAVEEYLFTGTFGQMAKSLENQLADKIKETCWGGAMVQIKNLAITYQLGPGASGKTLPVRVRQVGGVSVDCK